MNQDKANRNRKKFFAWKSGFLLALLFMALTIPAYAYDCPSCAQPDFSLKSISVKKNTFTLSTAEFPDAFEVFPLTSKTGKAPIHTTALSNSTETNSDKDKVNTNSGKIEWYKPPVRSGKIAGEFVVGTLAGLGLGYLGAYLGYSTAKDKGWFSGWTEAFIGFSVCYPLGCALGVSVVGNSGTMTGSFSRALGYSLMGMFGGWLGAYAMSHVSSEMTVLAFLAMPPILATVGFNSGRRLKSSALQNISLVSVIDGKIAFGIPAVAVTPSLAAPSKVDWYIRLAAISF
jgi:hypothetical protein